MTVPAFDPYLLENDTHSTCLIGETGFEERVRKNGQKKELNPTTKGCHADETNRDTNYRLVIFRIGVPFQDGDLSGVGRLLPLLLFRNLSQHTFLTGYLF